MGKMADMILLGDIDEKEDKTEKDVGKQVTDMVLGVPEIQRDWTETNEIDARTGKPRVEWTPTGKSGPSFGASVKSGFVDDPFTKIKIYAKARGIPVSKYRIIDGEIVYQDNDGKWYPEEKQLGVGKLKQIAGEQVATLPSAILSGAGAATGPYAPLMAPLGAAAGEGYRKFIGAYLGDPQSTGGNIKDMAKEAAIALAFERAGKLVSKATNYGGRKIGGNVATQTGSDLKFIDLNKAADVKKTAKDLGVDLTVPQTTGSKKLADKFNLLGDLDASSDIIQSARRKQQTQIQGAIDDFLNKIAGDGGKLKTGQRLKKAAQEVIEKPVKVRMAKAKPLYEKAFKNPKPVDTTDAISKITNLFKDLPEGKTAQRGVLSKVRRMLLKEESVNGKKVLVQQDNLKVLDNAKKAIDQLLSGPEGAAIEADMKRRLSIIKDSLVKSMDSSNPDYALARKVFETYSDEVNKQAGKTLTGAVAKLDDDQVVNASKRLFQSVATSPETVRVARSQIRKVDTKAWDLALRQYLQDIFEKQKLSAGGVDVTTNIGGMFFKRTYGDPAQRKIMKAAMTKSQYEYFEKLSQVLERAGMILRKESATATRQEMMKEIAGKTTTRVIEAQTRPMITKWKVIGDWFNKYRLGKNARELAEAMTTEKGHRQLNRVYQLSPKSERFIPALSVFLGVIGSDVALKSAHGYESE